MRKSNTQKADTEHLQADLIETLIAEWGERRPDIDASAMNVVGRIMRVSRELETRIATMLEPYGLLYSEFDVLATLARAGDPYELTPTELQEAVVLSSGAMTALLDRLQKKGLISRKKSKKDGRSKTAKITARGLKLTNTLIEMRFEEAQFNIDVLRQKECEQVSRALKKMERSLMASPGPVAGEKRQDA